MNIAAIDIGSNAIRLSLAKTSQNLGGFHDPKDLIKKHRFPCRLGTDVFKLGKIGPEKEEKLHSIFKELQQIIKLNNVEKVMGVATSAFRDAQNGSKLLEELSQKYETPCKIISGIEEAQYMSQGLLQRDHFKSEGAHLHADIGGGSLELSMHYKGEFVFQKSLDLGTLRLIQDTQSGELVPNYLDLLDLIDKTLNSKEAQTFIAENLPSHFEMHGTGGNFKRIGKLRTHLLNKKSDHKVRTDEIDPLIAYCQKHPGVELSKHTSIKEDNASLIFPSLLMIQRILKYWPAKKVSIPNLSLSHTILDKMN